jgi:hypothetical protein
MKTYRFPILAILIAALAAFGASWVEPPTPFAPQEIEQQGLKHVWLPAAVSAPASLPRPIGHGYGYAAVLSHKDLRRFDLAGEGFLLEGNVDWDTATLWPASLPPGFDPERILELGKNSGLGLRELHRQGVTGRGVPIAFIDQRMSAEHQEFAGGSLRLMEVGVGLHTADLPGEAPASLLAGKSTGVAPEAGVVYYAIHGGLRALETTAATVEQILDQNRSLPPDRRIRAIGTAQYIGGRLPGYVRLMQAVARAKREGVLFVWTDSPDYRFAGLDRQPLGDPDDPGVYLPGMTVRGRFYAGDPSLRSVVWVPMDSRTMAGTTGPQDYQFEREGASNRTVPWVTGLYALAAQVKPEITPAEFYRLLAETGAYRTITRNGQEYRLGPIANPPALIARLQSP